MTKPLILIPNSQKNKETKKQIIAGFSSKSLKFCLRIKIFVQMLKKEVVFAKFRLKFKFGFKNVSWPRVSSTDMGLGKLLLMKCSQTLSN